MERDKAQHDRRLIYVVLGFLLLLALGCLWVVVVPGYPVTTTDKAWGILIAIVGALGGYFAGQKKS
jgi:steroid 5-alpha reductase family enzyme